MFAIHPGTIFNAFKASITSTLDTGMALLTNSSTLSSLVSETLWSLTNLLKLPYQFIANANSPLALFSLSYAWARFDYLYLLVKSVLGYNPLLTLPAVSS